MSCLHGRLRLLAGLIGATIAICGISSCGRLAQTNEQANVTRAFDGWKTALINHQINQALAYIPRDADAYLTHLNSAAPVPEPTTKAAPSSSPRVDLLLRTALQKKVPADLRSKLTLSALVQRIAERNLFNPRDVREIDLGQVTILDNRHASAEVYYQKTLTALRLPFIKDDDGWKIDVMALLPYAEVLMRVDRAIKGQTEAQQVDQLVSKLPSL